jgi:hypothetical protein
MTHHVKPAAPPTLYFGRAWDDPKLFDPPAELTHVETPVGRACLYCGDRFMIGERGVLLEMDSLDACKRPVVIAPPVHQECELRWRLGSWGHFVGQCPCASLAFTGDDVPKNEHYIPSLRVAQFTPAFRAEALDLLKCANAERARHGLGPM